MARNTQSSFLQDYSCSDMKDRTPCNSGALHRNDCANRKSIQHSGRSKRERVEGQELQGGRRLTFLPAVLAAGRGLIGRDRSLFLVVIVVDADIEGTGISGRGKSVLAVVWSMREGGFEARFRWLGHDDGQQSLCVFEQGSSRIVVGADQVRLVDAEDHVTDGQTGLFSRGARLDVRDEDSAS